MWSYRSAPVSMKLSNSFMVWARDICNTTLHFDIEVWIILIGLFITVAYFPNQKHDICWMQISPHPRSLFESYSNSILRVKLFYVHFFCGEHRGGCGVWCVKQCYHAAFTRFYIHYLGVRQAMLTHLSVFVNTVNIKVGLQ